MPERGCLALPRVLVRLGAAGLSSVHCAVGPSTTARFLVVEGRGTVNGGGERDRAVFLAGPRMTGTEHRITGPLRCRDVKLRQHGLGPIGLEAREWVDRAAPLAAGGPGSPGGGLESRGKLDRLARLARGLTTRSAPLPRRRRLDAQALRRIRRFPACSRNLIPERPQAWGRVALAHGYADQAHLNREFSRLSGRSPTQVAPNIAVSSTPPWTCRAEFPAGPEMRRVPAGMVEQWTTQRRLRFHRATKRRRIRILRS